VTGATEIEVAEALEKAAGSAKTAIVILLGHLTAKQATRLLEQSRGSVRHALLLLESSNDHEASDTDHEA
jgi:N-acetylmuramic acid 6-phosphate (MurNAc-6-P) etherase